MANELKHKDAGVALTRTEDNAVDRHEADGETTNDMLYFNGTYWIRATPTTIVGLLSCLLNIVEDLSPQLGANLECNSFSIRDTVNGLALSAGNQAMAITAGGDIKTFDTDGNLNMNANKIIGLAAPTGDNDAARKKYVDDNVGISNIVEDITPQLGANLELNNFSLRDTTNGVAVSAGAQAVTITAGGDIKTFDTDGNLNMNANKIIGLAAGTATGHAARYDELETVDGKVDTVDAKLDDVSVSDVQGTRAVDTVYRNTSGKIRIVTCGFRWSTGGNRGNVEARIGAASPPTTHCCQQGAEQGSSEYGSLTFVVPNNYYYGVYATGDTPDTTENWVEYDLF